VQAVNVTFDVNRVKNVGGPKDRQDTFNTGTTMATTSPWDTGNRETEKLNKSVLSSSS